MTTEPGASTPEPRGLVVANAPVSYGAFEITVGIDPNVPDAIGLLDAVTDAGYAGIDLGPVGYLGTGAELAERLRSRGLGLAGGYLELPFSEPEGCRRRWRSWTGFLTSSMLSAGARPGAEAHAGRRRLAGALALPGPRCARPVAGTRRRRVGALRGRTRAGRRSLPPPWLRANVPSPHGHIHRGAMGDRADAGGERRRSVSGHRSPPARPRRPADRRARMVGADQPRPSEGRAQRDSGGDRRRSPPPSRRSGAARRSVRSATVTSR